MRAETISTHNTAEKVKKKVKLYCVRPNVTTFINFLNLLYLYQIQSWKVWKKKLVITRKSNSTKPTHTSISTSCVELDWNLCNKCLHTHYTHYTHLDFFFQFYIDNYTHIDIDTFEIFWYRPRMWSGWYCGSHNAGGG